MTDKTGGPAFPKTGNYNTDTSTDYDSYDQDGMTLRDYFAGKALTGMLGTGPFRDGVTYAQISESAYLYADAMLAARSKT